MPPGTRHRSPGPLAGIADPLYLLPSEGRAVASLDSDGTGWSRRTWGTWKTSAPPGPGASAATTSATDVRSRRGGPQLQARDRRRHQAAYEDRRAGRPGAMQVILVDRLVVEQPVESHGIAECACRVARSPRAVSTVLAELAGLAAAGRLNDPKWERALRVLETLNQVLMRRPPT